MKFLKTYLRRYPFSLTCIAMTWYLCFFHPPQIEMPDVEGTDKWAHCAMYLGTCSTIWWEYARSHARMSRKKLFWLAFVLPILMSGAIELLQNYCTDYRGGEWADFWANTLGVVLATLVGRYFLWHIYDDEAFPAS